MFKRTLSMLSGIYLGLFGIISLVFALRWLYGLLLGQHPYGGFLAFPAILGVVFAASFALTGIGVCLTSTYTRWLILPIFGAAVFSLYSAYWPQNHYSFFTKVYSAIGPILIFFLAFNRRPKS